MLLQKKNIKRKENSVTNILIDFSIRIFSFRNPSQRHESLPLSFGPLVLPKDEELSRM